MSKKETAVVPYTDFALAKVDAKEVAAIIQENTGPHGFDQFDLDRIKVPGGESLAWMIPTLEGEPDVAKTFDGIVIAYKDVRSYWVVGYEESGGGSPPDCSSSDGFSGVGDPGGNCEKCPLAQFGSEVRDGQPARGQACSQRRLLFIMRPDELMPTVLSIPPTSLKNNRTYFLKLGSRTISYYGAITRFGLEAAQSADGHAHPKVTFRKQATIEGEQLEALKAFQAQIGPSLAKVRASAADFDHD